MTTHGHEPASEPTTRSDEQALAGIEFAWKSHAAQESWTAKVDTKASVFFTLNVAGVIALTAFRTQTDGLLAAFQGWRIYLVDVGILACALALIIAGAAIFPLLGSPKAHRLRRDTIYFGHLRHRNPHDLAAQLAGTTAQERIEQLSRQLVVMSKANWLKHRLLQVALLVAVAGYGVIFTVVMLA